MEGDFATLVEPYMGSRNIRLISKSNDKWRAIICQNSEEIEVLDEDFELN